MELVSNVGIYKIVCLVTKKIYIGSSVNLKRRKFWHFCQLRNNKHANIHLQNAFNKYGSDSFNFSVIEFLPEEINKQDIIEIEQKYINELDACNPKVGYNLCKIAGQPGIRTGFKHSEKTIELMSEQRKGKPKSKRFKETLSKMFRGKSMKERTNNPEWSSNKKGKTMKEITNNPDWIDSKIGKPRPQWLKQKLSEERRGEKNPMFGKRFKRSPEQTAAQTGENNHMFGKTGNKHHNFDPTPIILINKLGETAAKTRFEWRSQKVDINAILKRNQQSSKGWSLPS